MYLERKQDLSLYFFIKDVFEDYEFINVVDSYPEQEIALPVIAVEVNEISTIKWELGNTKRLQTRSWIIDIFTMTKTQRNEFAYRLLNELEQCVPVYDYDEGQPPDNNPTRLGCLLPEDIKLNIIQIMPELVETMYYRARIIFTAVYDQF